MTKTEYRNEWEARVVSYKSSGIGVTVWCKANDVNKERFKYWLYKQNKRNTEPAAKKSKQWIAIETTPVTLNKQENMLIVNVGQASIQIKSGFDSVLLGEVVKALAGSC
jgi:hypothetical protein